MFLPQLVGLKCVRCQEEIGSELKATFCANCGNPVHTGCLDSASSGAVDGRCAACGGDPSEAVAVEVRKARQPQEAPKPKGPYPVSTVCPNCGHKEFQSIRPESWIAFTKDRICQSCQTRYTPPTPAWASLVFLLAGLLLAGFGLFSLTLHIRSGDPAGLLAMVIEGSLGLLGILAIVHGFRELFRP